MQLAELADLSHDPQSCRIIFVSCASWLARVGRALIIRLTCRAVTCREHLSRQGLGVSNLLQCIAGSWVLWYRTFAVLVAGYAGEHGAGWYRACWDNGFQLQYQFFSHQPGSVGGAMRLIRMSRRSRHCQHASAAITFVQ